MIVITGGNTGIGFEVAKRLLGKGISVCLGLRSEEKCEATKTKLMPFAAGNASLDFGILDLSNKDSVKSFATTISQKPWKIDVLVHNGGAFFSSAKESPYPGVELTLATNHLGSFLLTHELLKLDCFNKQAARIVIVSSSLHDPARHGGAPPDFDLQNLDGSKRYNDMVFYKTSKLCNLWFMYQLLERLPKHITVNALCPGFIPSSDLTRSGGAIVNFAMKWILPLMPFTRSLEHGAETYLQLMLDPAYANVTGKYYDDRKERNSSVDSLDVNKQKICWDWSCKATGIESSSYGH